MNNIKILVADDMEVIIDNIKNYVQKIEGVEVVEIAKNGIEEYEKILKLKPDLVFTDNQMPGLTGIEVIEKINNSNIEKKPEFVLITAEYSVELVNKINELKILNLIRKPIEMNKIDEVIAEFKIIACEEKMESIENDQSKAKEKKQNIFQKILNFKIH